jgi:hypothetical protein
MNFRKMFVLVALVAVMASMASAQVTAGAMTCTANAAVPPTLRAEGLTELVGDIVIDCVGGQPTPTVIQGTATPQAIPQANITVFLNTNITSRLISTGLNGIGAATSEALLIIDEAGAPGSPVTGGQMLCNNVQGCVITGTGSQNASGYTVAGAEPYNGGVARPNLFQGIVVTNSLQFIGVPIDPPGTSGHRIFRITNLRANASGVSGGPAGTPGTIQALVSISGSTALPINNPTQVVGYVQQGLVFNVRARGDAGAAPSATALAYPQCNSLSRTSSSATNAFILQFQENFPTAFKTRITQATQNVPGSIYNSESGFFASGGFLTTSGGANASIGQADSGTRLKAVFANIPNGVNLYVSTTQLTGTATSTSALANLLTGEVGLTQNASATNTDFPVNSSVMGGATQSATQLVPVGGAATAVWEVVGANALSADSYAFGVWFSWTGNAAQNLPAPGIGTVTGGFAPTPTGMGVSTTTAASASSSLNIPRFVDGTQTRNVLTVYVCRTNILFPFVTNQGGFDTGLAISNTSTDPFGTATQAGGCTLFAYGDNAGASVPTGPIAAGKTAAVLASSVMTNFQGYVIAQCAFQYAHGFAFVSDFGARNLAMGYLGIIIPEPGVGTRGANPLSSSSAGSGEQLGQ